MELESLEVLLLDRQGAIVKHAKIPYLLSGSPDVIMLGDQLYVRIQPTVHLTAYRAATLYEIRLESEDCPTKEWSANQ